MRATRTQVQRHRRARQVQRHRVVTTFTARQWRTMVAQVGRCLCCGATENLCADHVIPVTAGGANVWGNIQVLCRSCNAKKGTRMMDYRVRHLVQTQFDFTELGLTR